MPVSRYGTFFSGGFMNQLRDDLAQYKSAFRKLRRKISKGKAGGVDRSLARVVYYRMKTREKRLERYKSYK